METDSLTQKTNLWSPNGKVGGGINQEFRVGRSKLLCIKQTTGPPWWCVVKNPPASAGQTGSIPGTGRFHTLRSSSAQKPALLLLLLLGHFSRVRLCATPQTAAHQAPLAMGFSRPEYWSRVPLPTEAQTQRARLCTQRSHGNEQL